MEINLIRNQKEHAFLNIAKEIIKALDEKKAEDIKTLDISNVSVMADYFIIASGNNRNQLQAICDNVIEKLHKTGHDLKQVEGYDTANWILMDYSDVIVHIFDKENRLFYDLERIWSDGKEVILQYFRIKNEDFLYIQKILLYLFDC